MIKKKIVIFEVEGGSDKWINGLRKDTMPIVRAFENLGWICEVLYFRDEWKDEIYEYTKANFSGFISRINPGNLPYGEELYFETLRKLSEIGVVAISHPDEMLKLGAKDILIKLKNTAFAARDTYGYHSIKEFRNRFPFSLAQKQRVLKQNRGSTGVGIWKVEIYDDTKTFENEPLPLDTLVQCTEAQDNHMEIHTLDDFMMLCEKYMVENNSMLIDMPYLERISEGELRLLLIGEKPMAVIHKKPSISEDAFSATMFSGAKYTIFQPEVYPDLIRFFEANALQIIKYAKLKSFPMLWTADFILDFDEQKKDKYVLSEINCSCVGIPEKLIGEFENSFAREVIERIESNFTLKIK